MSKDTNNRSQFISDALKVVQEGLKSMQHLQSQTAAAHQKFLEAQTEANRSLQEMMQHTQRLTEQSLGFELKPRQPVALSRLPLESTRQSQAPERIDETSTSEYADSPLSTVRPENVLETGPLPVAQNLPEAAANGYPRSLDNRVTAIEAPVPTNQVRADIEATMLAVVSQLTGYPVEMLGMDMDIESELGIDSIKRVEILSTLEEKMPDLPTVSPEIMGSLKTLGQIAAYLNESGGTNQSETRSDLSLSAAKAASAEPESTASEDQQIKIEATMLAVVSQLTGYPVEMLGMDMDIESELGIDSIKRVEILSILEEKMPDLPIVSPEIMGSLKTLGQIAEFLAKSTDFDSAGEKPGEKPTDIVPAVAMDRPSFYDPGEKWQPVTPDTAGIPRNVVSIVEAPAIAPAPITLAPDKKVFVTEDNTGLAEQITEALTKLGIGTIRISLDILNYKKQLPAAAGLIIVQDPHSDKPDQNLKDAFALTRYLAPHLIDSAKQGGALFATVTRLDGAFGLKGCKTDQPAQGGLAGLVKTAAIEWQNVCCHAIDIAPNWSDKHEIAAAVVREVLAPGPVEIGLNSNHRCTLTLRSKPYPEGQINLETGEVVVITGGARGITAEAARALANEVAPTLILLGRSPQPQAEPEWLTPLTDETAIKKAILDHEFNGHQVTPGDIEKSFKTHMANREIAANLAAIGSTGADVYYYDVDIRDFKTVATVLKDIRINHGPIAAIIHGAGVLEDRLIIDKTVDQFERVFDTKVKGLNNLLQAAHEEDLKYLVLFSSVAARMGNKGQADYAVANEVLNKMAQNEARNRPDCRVVSINWGPWDGGMVTDALKRQFERQGINLIPLDQGVQCMLHEMRADSGEPVEIVIGAEITTGQDHVRRELKRPELVKPTPAVKKQQLSLSFEREIDVTNHPILKSHIIDGKPVVPMALMTEWFAHGALHANPGLVLHGLDDIRILKGIRLGAGKKSIRMLAGKLDKNGEFYEVRVELRNGPKVGKDIIHSSAKAILSNQLPPAPAYQFSKAMVAKAYPKKIEDVYENILFHGDQLHGIQKIVSCSSRGMVARISPAPAPAEWISTPLRNRWIGDPLVLDSAFQMATVWCFEEKGIVSLPSYGASYRQYCAQFPSEGVTIVLEVKEATSRKMRGDFTFLDSSDEIVARLTGFEAIMDPSLLRAFKPQYKASA
jgi:NAD(P)-dependent dehydrogenase (short-subunit alcohol dehydrogenase family)/acyl carrier protein